MEQLRRYFRSFGPASVKDAAYYFGMTQTAVKRLLHGAVAGRRKRSGKRLQITRFRPFTPEERSSAEQAAERIWGDAAKLVWLDT